MHRIPSILWDRREIKGMQNNANISSSPCSPRRCFCTTGFPPQLLHTVPPEGYLFPHCHDRQAELISLPPAPSVTQNKFPRLFSNTESSFHLKQAHMHQTPMVCDAPPRRLAVPPAARDSSSNPLGAAQTPEVPWAARGCPHHRASSLSPAALARALLSAAKANRHLEDVQQTLSKV